MAKLTYEELNITEPEEGVIEFEVLPEHLKLLRSAYVAYQETENGWGTFQVNEKTPYGSKHILRDVTAILGPYEETPPNAVEYFKALHKGAAMALQIFLKTGKFKAAKYRTNKYSQDWKEYRPKVVKEKKSEEADLLEHAAD